MGWLQSHQADGLSWGIISAFLSFNPPRAKPTGPHRWLPARQLPEAQRTVPRETVLATPTHNSLGCCFAALSPEAVHWGSVGVLVWHVAPLPACTSRKGGLCPPSCSAQPGPGHRGRSRHSCGRTVGGTDGRRDRWTGERIKGERSRRGKRPPWAVWAARTECHRLGGTWTTGTSLSRLWGLGVQAGAGVGASVCVLGPRHRAEGGGGVSFRGAGPIPSMRLHPQDNPLPPARPPTPPPQGPAPTRESGGDTQSVC